MGAAGTAPGLAYRQSYTARAQVVTCWSFGEAYQCWGGVGGPRQIKKFQPEMAWDAMWGNSRTWPVPYAGMHVWQCPLDQFYPLDMDLSYWDLDGYSHNLFSSGQDLEWGQGGT